MLTTPTSRPPPPGSGSDGSPAQYRPPLPTPAAAPPRPSLPDAWPTVALTFLTVASTTGFDRVYEGHSWIAPVIVTAVGAHMVAWALRRWRLPQLAALVIAVAAVLLLAMWTVLGPYTRYGLPLSGAWHHFGQAISSARQDFSSALAPVDATAGFRLVSALGAGIVAVLADWLAFRTRAVLIATTPAFALFIVCCTTGTGRGRGLVIAAEIAGVLLFLMAHTATAGGAGRAWFAGKSAGVAGWLFGTGGLIGLIVVVAALLVSPQLAGQDGVGALGWRSGIGPGAGGQRVVANPIVSLYAELTDPSDTEVFTVASSVPSYWRLTSLDNFDGTAWTSTGSYRGIGKKLPGVTAVPPATRTVTEQFDIVDLESAWLPAAFDPVAVQGLTHVSYDPVSNSLLTDGTSSDHLRYSVTSYQLLSTLSPAELQAAPPLTGSELSSMRSDLALPDDIPSSVQSLALQLTAGKTTEYAKALAIQDYLRSPPFVYSLQPPSDGNGPNAIANFLFDTKSGYCQQYAGSYAVLARYAGLPTRLAVGFDLGTSIGSGAYEVADNNAHTWPEVYFGPKYGWLPFEPTPTFANPSATNYDPTSPSSGGSQSTSPTTVSPTTSVPASRVPTRNRATPTTVAGAAKPAAGHGSSGGGWLLPLALILLAVPAWAGINLGIRRLRWQVRRRRGGSRGDAGQVLSMWSEVLEMLAWRGLAQDRNESDDEYAVRTAERLGARRGDLYPGVAGRVTQLAGLVQQAAFAARMGPDGPPAAQAAAAEIRRGLIRSASRRQLITWVFWPSGAGRRRPVGYG